MELKDLTPEQLEKYNRVPAKNRGKLLAIFEERATIHKTLAKVAESDPFWFFRPSDGTIPDENKAFLEKWLRPEDIPQRLDSQLDVILSDKETVGASGGNQSGKSVVGAIINYIEGLGVIPTSLKGIYPTERLRTDFSETWGHRVVGVDHKTMMNTLIPTYKHWCPKEFLKNGKWKDSFSADMNTLSLYQKGKAKPILYIEFMTNQQDVDSFQGPPLRKITYDEEPLEKIRKENLLRFTTTKLNELFCSTPTKGLTWTAELFNDEDADKIERFKLCSVTNRKANMESLESIISKLESYDEIKMRLLGEYISLSGLIYGNRFDKKTHIIQPFFEDLTPHQQKNDYICLGGLDPHTNTPTAIVFLLVDRELNCYVDRCHFGNADTTEVREAFHRIVDESNYRMGWSVADKSSDSTNVAFNSRNIFKELRQSTTNERGEPVKGIPALRKSDKFEGSIHAGVDIIKQRLKFDDNQKPTLYIVNRPENKALITSFTTLERETYANEDEKGPKDKIKEGKHHLHAAMRYIFQFAINFYTHEAPVYDNSLEDDTFGNYTN